MPYPVFVSAEVRSDLIVDAVDESREVLEAAGQDPPVDPAVMRDENLPWKRPFRQLLQLLERPLLDLSDEDVVTAGNCRYDIHARVASQGASLC